MSGVATAIVGSAAIGYIASSKASGAQQSAASEATAAQRDIANQQAQVQKEMFEKQVELQAPFREAGLKGQNRLMELLGIGGTAGAPGYGKYATAEFGADKFQADPGYAFRMSEGMKALERSAAARGGLLSGATLRGTQRYGQDLASQEYQNAFNRYQAERTGTLNPYQALAGTAQSSANTLGSQAGQYGANVSNILGTYGAGQASNIIGAGNAQASGYMGAANAIAGGVGQGINFYQNQQLMNRLLPGGSTSAPVFDYSTPYAG
jgi:hypothetical protein